MPQVSLYVDDETMSLIKERAKASGQSLSRFTSEAVRAYQPGGWPADYWNLYGSLGDQDSCIEEVNDLDLSLDDQITALC